MPQYFCTALLCGSILSGRITSREIPLQFVKFACGSRVGLATLAAAERRYAFCVGLGVLVGNGWVENAAGIGGRRQSRWRSLLPAALLSLNFFFGSPDIDSETGATFFFVLKGAHANVDPWPPQHQCFWAMEESFHSSAAFRAHSSACCKHSRICSLRLFNMVRSLAVIDGSANRLSVTDARILLACFCR